MKTKILVIIIVLLFLGITISKANDTKFLKIEDKYELGDPNSSWQQINIDGFGDKFNIAPRGIEVFNGYLLVGTANLCFYNGSISIIPRNKPILQSLIEHYNIFKHNNHTFTSTGCEIWSYDGEKWIPVVGKNGYMPGGFDDNNTNHMGFLISYKDYLYAGVWNVVEGCQVWRTDDLKTWAQVVSEGFGNRENFWAVSAIVFNNELYVGTGNFNRSEIYKTNNGLDWVPVVGGGSATEAGFGMKDNMYMWSMCVYNSYLYVGTANNKGLEIWRTNNGVDWEPIIAYNNIFQAKKHGADYPRAMGRYCAGPARNMMVFNNELYVFCSIRGYLRFIFEAFGKELFDRSFTVPVLDYVLFNLVPRSGQIWKYNSTSDKWTQVVGGWGKRNNSAGFGDRLNQYLWAVSVYNDSLYVGTMYMDPTVIRIKREGFLNWTLSTDVPSGKAEIWKTADGNNWEQANDDGFGDEYNLGVREMKVYQNSLYACTANANTGCEVWMYNE